MEDKRLGLVVSGSYFEYCYTHSTRSENTYSLFHMKGLIETLFLEHSISLKATDLASYLHPKKQCLICDKNGDTLGFLGTIHPKVAASFNVSDDTVIAEMSLSSFDLDIKLPIFQAINKFPSVKRDMALLVPKTLSYGDIKSFLSQHVSSFVIDFYLFDMFESEQLGEDKKSIAITFTYENPEASLTDDQVNTLHHDLTTLILDHFPVSIR